MSLSKKSWIRCASYGVLLLCALSFHQDLWAKSHKKSNNQNSGQPIPMEGSKREGGSGEGGNGAKGAEDANIAKEFRQVGPELEDVGVKVGEDLFH